jgi:hypothetical protein
MSQKSSGRSHSHVGPPLLYTRRLVMDMLSRGYIHICLCHWVGQIGESGALGREGWRVGRGYSEVLRR